MTDRLLRFALGFNSGFSLTTGLPLLLAPTMVGQWIGFEHVLTLQIVGSSLLLYSALLAYLAVFSRHPQFLAMLATFADFAWVLATFSLWMSVPATFSGLGWLIMTGIAVIVLACGIAQAIGIDLSYRNQEMRGWLRLCMETRLDASPSALWGVIREVGEIHRYSPFLVSSEITSLDEDSDLQTRECRDQKGNSWSEQLTLDEQNMQLHANFSSERPDFPFPFTQMQGGWDIEEADEGSILRVWWNVVPKHRSLAFLLMPMTSFNIRRGFQPTIVNIRNAATKSQDEKTIAVNHKKVRLGVC